MTSTPLNEDQLAVLRFAGLSGHATTADVETILGDESEDSLETAEALLAELFMEGLLDRNADPRRRGFCLTSRGWEATGEGRWVTRPAFPGEANTIQEIAWLAFKPYRERMNGWIPAVEDDYRERIGDGSVFVVDDCGRPAGFSVLAPIADDRIMERVLVLTIAVRPDRQRKGIGRALLEHAEGVAQEGNGKVVLAIYRLDLENLARYERRGYHELEQRDVDGVDQIFLGKQL